MEIENVADTATSRDPECCEKKHKGNCVINIFCGEEKQERHHWDDCKKIDDDNCVVNIFCGDEKHDWDGCNKKVGNCIINIFCCEKKHDCDDKKHDDDW